MNTPSNRDDESGGPGREPERDRPDAEAHEPDSAAAGATRRERAQQEGDPLEAAESDDERPLEAEEPRTSGAATRSQLGLLNGVFVAETFAVTAVITIAAALVGPRLVQMLSSVTAQDQVSAVAGMILGDAVVALLGVVLGLVALWLAGESGRPWTRWTAGATVLIGLAFLVVSLVAFLLVPPPTPTAPPM
ncbi:hypothetical protein [Streptomonospora litoralis]|uniref:Uncharacterized protein n=1 Tax=Streptomonospora litoralis TaxID=2498135 RepID=A0A4P6Q3H4_9ACTN|nr:hypothetical protein [Streptomonospora litoralis]QBI53237.1 hypothetical protein EKD16_07205 [Streptomonospora litoralis]